MSKPVVGWVERSATRQFPAQRGSLGRGCVLTQPTLMVLVALLFSTTAQAQQPAPFAVTADTIAAPLAGLKGDAERGRKLAFDPERGNCTICHPVPGGDARGQGTVGPPLAGVGGRLSTGQMRLRLVDGTRINPDTIMPPYHRIDGLNRVGREWAGKPVLSAQDVEDIVAFLETLK